MENHLSRKKSPEILEFYDSAIDCTNIEVWGAAKKLFPELFKPDNLPVDSRLTYNFPNISYAEYLCEIFTEPTTIHHIILVCEGIISLFRTEIMQQESDKQFIFCANCLFRNKSIYGPYTGSNLMLWSRLHSFEELADSKYDFAQFESLEETDLYRTKNAMLNLPVTKKTSIWLYPFEVHSFMKKDPAKGEIKVSHPNDGEQEVKYVCNGTEKLGKVIAQRKLLGDKVSFELLVFE